LVKGCQITCTPTEVTNGIFGISLVDDTNVAIGYTHVRNTKDTKMSVLTASSSAPTISNYYNVNQNFDPSYQGETSALFGSNPADQMYFQCWYEGPSAAANPSSISFLVTLTYTVDMWELKDLGSS
jgi:hypothetical protein